MTAAELATRAARAGYAVVLKDGPGGPNPALVPNRPHARMPADLGELFRANREAVVRWLRGEPDPPGTCEKCLALVCVPELCGEVCDSTVCPYKPEGRRRE